ncbi:MAG: hypothetical protein ACKVRP_05630 [Bacteroidota bacterium]
MLLLLVSHASFGQVATFVYDSTLTYSSTPTGIPTPSHFPNVRLPQDIGAAQLSPVIAVDPTDEESIVIGTSNFRSGYDAIGQYLSTNHGRGWTGTLNEGALGPFESPSIAFNDYLGTNPNLFMAFSDRSLEPEFIGEIKVAFSYNRGETWESPISIGDSGVTTPYMVIDNNDASPYQGHIYVAYTKF